MRLNLLSLSLVCLQLFHHVTGSAINCPAPSPCVCNGGLIDCRMHRTPSIPVFHNVPGRFQVLDFSYNNVTHLQRAAFAVLNVSELYLDFNYISNIDDDAFAGTELVLKVLSLAHNHLKTLPVALSRLTRLSDLDISYNPMNGRRKIGHHHTDDFTDSVMRALGASLTKLTFGDYFLMNWPGTLTHLQQLQTLHVAHSDIRVLAHTAFHGFEHTLINLTISHSNLAQLPLAVETLSKLEEFHLDHNRYTDGDSVILDQPLIAVHKTLKVLSFRYDHLKVIPEVISSLTMLQNISLDGNPFEFISEEAINFIQHTSVHSLTFRDCGLKRIPGSLSGLANLIEVDFSNNQIRTIESNDLRHIPTLQRLILSYNPLKFISREAFVGFVSLSLLDMSNSTIVDIPLAISNLDRLQTLDLRNSPIDCTCDLSWVRRLMNYIQLYIDGDCETIDQGIQDYVLQRIPTCLDYTSGASIG